MEQTQTQTTFVSPHQARFIACVLKNRFPWIGTEEQIDLSDAVSDIAEFVEVLDEIGARVDVPASVMTAEAVLDKITDMARDLEGAKYPTVAESSDGEVVIVDTDSGRTFKLALEEF